MAETTARPLIGWDVRSVDTTTVILDLQTASNGEKHRAIVDGTAEPIHVKAFMTPEQCLALSEELMRQGLALMVQSKAVHRR